MLPGLRALQLYVHLHVRACVRVGFGVGSDVGDRLEREPFCYQNRHRFEHHNSDQRKSSTRPLLITTENKKNTQRVHHRHETTIIAPARHNYIVSEHWPGPYYKLQMRRCLVIDLLDRFARPNTS